MDSIMIKDKTIKGNLILKMRRYLSQNFFYKDGLWDLKLFWTEVEELIVKESRRTGFRYRRLSGYLQRKYGIKISENTNKAILRRNNVKRKTRRSCNGKNRSLYDYEALLLFKEFQLDTKHLLDKDSLPEGFISI